MASCGPLDPPELGEQGDVAQKSSVDSWPALRGGASGGVGSGGGGGINGSAIGARAVSDVRL